MRDNAMIGLQQTIEAAKEEQQDEKRESKVKWRKNNAEGGEAASSRPPSLSGRGASSSCGVQDVLNQYYGLVTAHQ